MYPYQDWDIAGEQAIYVEAMAERRDQWVAAGCGTETPYPVEFGTRWVLYVYNPAQDRHGYLDMGTDIVYSELADMLS